MADQVLLFNMKVMSKVLRCDATVIDDINALDVLALSQTDIGRITVLDFSLCSERLFDSSNASIITFMRENFVNQSLFDTDFILTMLDLRSTLQFSVEEIENLFTTKTFSTAEKQQVFLSELANKAIYMFNPDLLESLLTKMNEIQTQ